MAEKALVESSQHMQFKSAVTVKSLHMLDIINTNGKPRIVSDR